MLQFLRRLAPGAGRQAPAQSPAVDTDLPPRHPDWMSFERRGAEHRGMGTATLAAREGRLYVGDREVVLHLASSQQGDREVGGHALRAELRATPGRDLNARVKDHLLDHPELIPADWEGRIYFWGTVGANAKGGLAVSCLRREEGVWSDHWSWLDVDWLGGGAWTKPRWDSGMPAARLAPRAADSSAEPPVPA